MSDRVHLTCALSPAPRSLDHLGLPKSPMEETVQRVLASEPKRSWQSSGLGRELYLNMAERIVRSAADWVDERGAVIDPVAGVECGQTTPRFAAPGAILLSFGRIADLQPLVHRTMDYACRRLAAGEAASPDFWMRELATAFLCLSQTAEPADTARWRDALSSVIPERTYAHVRPDGEGLESLHNWTVYAAAGEYLRSAAGLAPAEADAVWGAGFFDKYMDAQRTHFSAHGMYRDPGDPITYDITTRLQIATALVFGYEGPLRADLSELLRRGGLAMLLFVSSGGFVPYGGRSSQFQFQEAIVSALSEIEAARYAATDARLAGAFKRQAHLCANAVHRWLDMEPLCHIKNGFDRATSWGRDAYGHYSVYSLLAASFLGLAALLADDGIEEAPCPAEIGGYTVELPEAFHKVFASVGQSSLEIDTRAHLHHDATGLGRFCSAGAPLELGPGMPLTSTPSYVLPEGHVPRRHAAVGPEWLVDGQWVRLAELSEGLTSRLEQRGAPRNQEHFAAHYVHAASESEVTEHYRLGPGSLEIVDTVQIAGQRADRVRLIVPLLVTDGDAESRIEQIPGHVTVRYRGARLIVNFSESCTAWIEEESVGNRNGLYRLLTIENAGHCVGASLWLFPAEGEDQ